MITSAQYERNQKRALEALKDPVTTEAAWLLYEEKDDILPEVMCDALELLEKYILSFPSDSERNSYLKHIRAEKKLYEEQAKKLLFIKE